jgi:type IV pilus assembly protein PilA
VLTLCLGYLLIVVTKRRQGLHDLIAGTVVAYDATPQRPAWLVAGVSAGALVPLLAVLSAGALPAYRDYAIRAQVAEGLNLAGEYRKAIEAQWRNSPRGFVDLNSDSVGGGLPRSGQYVESIEIVSGMIVISYGAAASAGLAGSVLTLVPALDSQRTLDWACGYGPPPAGFEAVFEGHAGYTDIEQRYIPSSCRSATP